MGVTVLVAPELLGPTVLQHLLLLSQQTFETEQSKLVPQVVFVITHELFRQVPVADPCRLSEVSKNLLTVPWYANFAVVSDKHQFDPKVPQPGRSPAAQLVELLHCPFLQVLPLEHLVPVVVWLEEPVQEEPPQEGDGLVQVRVWVKEVPQVVVDFAGDHELQPPLTGEQSEQVVLVALPHTPAEQA